MTLNHSCITLCSFQVLFYSVIFSAIPFVSLDIHTYVFKYFFSECTQHLQRSATWPTLQCYCRITAACTSTSKMCVCYFHVLWADCFRLTLNVADPSCHQVCSANWNINGQTILIQFIITFSNIWTHTFNSTLHNSTTAGIHLRVVFQCL